MVKFTSDFGSVVKNYFTSSFAIQTNLDQLLFQIWNVKILTGLIYAKHRFATAQFVIPFLKM